MSASRAEHAAREIDPGGFVPGPVRKAPTEGVVRASVRELETRVES